MFHKNIFGEAVNSNKLLLPFWKHEKQNFTIWPTPYSYYEVSKKNPDNPPETLWTKVEEEEKEEEEEQQQQTQQKPVCLGT